MSRHDKNRRRIFRRDAGRAFLRFLIGEVLLLVLCSVFYLFVLQGKVSITLPAFLESTSPVPAEDTNGLTAVPADDATNVPDAQTSAVPTIEPTAEPTEEPTPEPTATPIPAEALSLPMEVPISGLYPQCDMALRDSEGALKTGIRELSLFDAASQSVVQLRAYAYIEGADAANSTIYVTVMDINSGETAAVYQAQPASAEADLAFEAASGINLEQAFFKVNLDASALPDGTFVLMSAVQSGDQLRWAYFDESISHFTVVGGVAYLSR